MALYKPKGSRVWVMDFWYDGRRIRESTRQTSITRAREVLHTRKQQERDGASGLKGKKKKPLLYDAAADWLELKTHKWSPRMRSIGEYGLAHLLTTDGKPSTLLKDGKFTGIAKSDLARKRVTDIDARDIARYQKGRLDEGASGRTINIEIGVLRQIMRRAGAWEKVRDSDAWRDVGMLEEREDAGHSLTPAEESALFLECGRSASRCLLPFVTLSLQTGARYNTIRTLTWGQVDFPNRCLRIGKDKTKAGTGRKVPLSPTAMNTLTAWAEQFPNRNPKHFVFPSEKYGLHGKEGTFGGDVRAYSVDPTTPVGTLKTSWASAKKRTQRHCPGCFTGLLADEGKGFRCVSCRHFVDELPAPIKIRIHDLRHSAVTRMIAARMPITTVARIVGWSKSTTAAMAARYAHPSDDEMRDAVECISGYSPQISPQSDAIKGENGG